LKFILIATHTHTQIHNEYTQPVFLLIVGRTYIPRRVVTNIAQRSRHEYSSQFPNF